MKKWTMVVVWALIGAGLLFVVLPELLEVRTKSEDGVVITQHTHDPGGACVLVTRPAPSGINVSFVVGGGTLALLTAMVDRVTALRASRQSTTD